MSHTQAEKSAPDRTTPHRSRTIRDQDGRAWLVREAPLPVFDRRTGLCLIFERPEVVRRIRFFPQNWLELTDGELYLVSEGV